MNQDSDRLTRVAYASGLQVLHWLVRLDIPPLSATVMLEIDIERTPISMADVARTTGLTNAQAARALHDLQARGYAVESNRKYEPTAAGRDAHEELRQVLERAVGSFSDQS